MGNTHVIASRERTHHTLCLILSLYFGLLNGYNIKIVLRYEAVKLVLPPVGTKPRTLSVAIFIDLSKDSILASDTRPSYGAPLTDLAL